MNWRTVLLNYFHQRNRGWVLSLFAAVCVIYLPFLGNPFVFDDLSFFVGDTVKHYTHSLFQFELRWLPYASLTWTYAIFSDVLPHIFRIGNMLLHAANVILLFFLLRQLVSAVIPHDEQSSAATWGAWFGALIFACNPVAVYAVGYLVERSILMATLFSLVTQLTYLRGLLTGQKRWFVLAVIAYFLACFSKEHSVMVPALLAAETILLRGTVGNEFGAQSKIIAGMIVLWSTWIALIAIALFVTLRSVGVLGAPYEPMAVYMFSQQEMFASVPVMHLLSALTQAGLFFKYILLWCVPNPAWMSVDMREHFISSWSAWQGWFGLFGFIAFGALGLWLLLRSRWTGLAGLALLYPWLLYMVEFSSIRVQESFVLYRSYLWLPGMMLFFPLLLAKLPGKKMLLGLGFVTLLLVPLAWNRLWVFADTYRLWNDAVLLLQNEHVPGADRIFYNRGSAELATQKWDEAILDFQRSVTLSPKLSPIHYALGLAYLNAKRNQEALIQFDTAISLKKDDANYYFAKGISLKRLHRDDLAMEQMYKSCELNNVKACLVIRFSREQQKKM